MRQKGFTLIELLIVIALLGALAIGLIGAIDPFEQLKKGQDTGTRNTVSEIHSATIRFFALKGYMPWCSDADTCTDPDSTALNSTPMNVAISRIIDTGELKSNFTTIQSKELTKVFVTGTSSDAKVCYKPVSKAFRSDANTKYLIDGDESGVACGTTDATACYWCVQ